MALRNVDTENLAGAYCVAFVEKMIRLFIQTIIVLANFYTVFSSHVGFASVVDKRENNFTILGTLQGPPRHARFNIIRLVNSVLPFS